MRKKLLTQGRTLDEVVGNIREVIELMFSESDAQLELLISPAILSGKQRGKPRSRRKHAKPAA
jgi:predicted RNase H-like HicB family nuclease